VVGHALKDPAVVPADNAAAAAPANNTVVMPDPAATNIPAAAPADNAAADNTVLAAVPATNAPADNTVLAADPETNAPANNTVLAATNTPAPPALHELFQSWENATVCAGSPTKRTSVQVRAIVLLDVQHCCQHVQPRMWSVAPLLYMQCCVLLPCVFRSLSATDTIPATILSRRHLPPPSNTGP
jgi:hypothetical protein